MDAIRNELIAALRGGQAYDKIDQILSEVPQDRRYDLPDGAERSAWQILEHMRLTLEDLCAYTDNLDGRYRDLKWPHDYWPAGVGSGDDWDRSRSGLYQAQTRMEELVRQGDLTKPFPWEPSHNLLREVILAIEHAAYHAGELVELTRRFDAARLDSTLH